MQLHGNTINHHPPGAGQFVAVATTDKTVYGIADVTNDTHGNDAGDQDGNNHLNQGKSSHVRARSLLHQKFALYTS